MPDAPHADHHQPSDRRPARATEAGATVITEPGRQPWGYAGTFADPDCHLWMVIAAAAAP